MINNLSNNKKGFTVIELAVTLVVLGTFILLAAPKFMSLIGVAEETRIQNDIRVAENLSVLEIYKNGFDLANNKDLNSDSKVEVAFNIEEAVANGKAYDITGKIESMDNVSGEQYFELDPSFIENNMRTSLNGKFLSTNDARVIYIETEETGTTLQDKANNIRTALLDKVTNNDSVEVANADVNELQEIANSVGINDAEELLESYTSLLSSIK